MKKISYCLSILALSALSAQDNLVTNGGFESGTGSWAVANGAAVSISTASANSGTQSGKLDFPNVDNSQLRQNIAVTSADALETYTLSFSANVEAAGYTELLGIRPTLMEWDGINPATYHFGDFEWIASGTTGWQTYSQEFTTTIANPTVFQVLFYYAPQGDPKVAGSVLMDDISLRVIPEPAAFALLGGLLALGSVMIRRRR